MLVDTYGCLIEILTAQQRDSFNVAAKCDGESPAYDRVDPMLHAHQIKEVLCVLSLVAFALVFLNMRHFELEAKGVHDVVRKGSVPSNDVGHHVEILVVTRSSVGQSCKSLGYVSVSHP